ncbi:hypothetical protein FRC04_004855, partial [Tulasnella sp. 424]
MSHLDFSEDDLIDAMSTISTISEVDSRSLSPCPCPATPKLPADETAQGADAVREWKHPKFYWSDFVDIQVEGTLYRVPRVMMQQSETFKSNLSTENSVGALYVDGITTQEMEAFLDVSDARLVTGDDHFTFEQWAGALAVANRMAIPRIRNHVIQRLQDALNRLDPFDCIDVADKYRVHEWLFQPFLRICERPEPLTPPEVLRLGPERSSAVGRVREKLLVHKYDSAISWVGDHWPRSSGRSYYRPPAPQWAVMSENLETALSIEAKRLIELETILSKPEFQPLSPSGKSDIESIHHGMPHPRYCQKDLKTIKTRNCLYQLPLRYFEQPHLLEGNQDHKELSPDARDIITLPDDVAVSDWNVFLEILTARPFDEPLLSLGFSAWMTGLRFAERFGNDSARRYIIQRIETDFPSQDPVDLLEAAKIAGSPDSDWLRGIYTTLSQRSGLLSPGDLRRIGEEATVQVWKLRDQFIYQQGYNRNE